MFCLRSLRVSKFKSLFQDNFVKGYKIGNQFKFSACDNLDFSSTVYKRDYPSSIEYSYLPWQILVNCISQFRHSVMSDSLWPHRLQHTSLPCPSPTHRAYSNSYLSNHWCHPTFSSSVIPLSSHLPSFPASESFPKSYFFTSGGQSIGVSASTSVLLMNIQYWFPLGWLVGSPCSLRESQESSPTPQYKSINSLVLSFLYSPTLTSIHDYWKNHSCN